MWCVGGWGLGSGDHWPAPMGAHERRSTAFQKNVPQNIRLCVAQERSSALFGGPGTAFPLTLAIPTVNLWLRGTEIVTDWKGGIPPPPVFCRPRLSKAPRRHSSHTRLGDPQLTSGSHIRLPAFVFVSFLSWSVESSSRISTALSRDPNVLG